MAARNMHGASDHMLPVELVLNVGVSKLVQAYRYIQYTVVNKC
jgi:hypothetical protein